MFKEKLKSLLAQKYPKLYLAWKSFQYKHQYGIHSALRLVFNQELNDRKNGYYLRYFHPDDLERHNISIDEQLAIAPASLVVIDNEVYILINVSKLEDEYGDPLTSVAYVAGVFYHELIHLRDWQNGKLGLGNDHHIWHGRMYPKFTPKSLAQQIALPWETEAYEAFAKIVLNNQRFAWSDEIEEAKEILSIVDDIKCGRVETCNV